MENLQNDHIKVNGLRLNAHLKLHPWVLSQEWQSTLQPVIISLDIRTDVRKAADADDHLQSVDYASVCAAVRRICDSMSETSSGLTLEDLAARIVAVCTSDEFPGTQEVSVELELPKALLLGKSTGMRINRCRHRSICAHYEYFINELSLGVLVGVYPHELAEKQRVNVNVSIVCPPDNLITSFDFAGVSETIIQGAEAARYHTLEALSTDLARRCLDYIGKQDISITIGIAKPAALPLADSAEVVVTRTLLDFQGSVSRLKELKIPALNSEQKHLAAVAIGSNLGDRFFNIETALRMLENPSQFLMKGGLYEWSDKGTVTIVDTSFMYETAPMYVVDQPKFLNCACLVETSLSCRELLTFLKIIENVVGRKPGVRFGPRVVDLDIITYDDSTIDTRSEVRQKSLDDLEGELVVPHPRMTEREFVLRPLADIIPEWRHPELHMSITQLLDRLIQSRSPDEPAMYKVMPFSLSGGLPIHRDSSMQWTSTYWSFTSAGTSFNKKTYIMATLNATPDSFSDGSMHNNISTALSYSASAVAAGVDIIDIGGYSTRPGAAFVSSEDEIQRVVPVIQAIRASEGKLRQILISVDTFRPEVARAALLAGANCINDVYAFSGPEYPPPPDSERLFEEMKALAREFAVPVIMMHSRGEAGSNKDYSKYRPVSRSTRDGQVIEGIRIELGEKVDRAILGKGGLRRWLVIVDPGVGFSKTLEGNLEVLRQASQVTADDHIRTYDVEKSLSHSLLYKSLGRNPLTGFPQLIGTSRKSFLGSLLAQPAAPTNPSTVDDSHPGRETTPSERGYATAAAVACAVQQGTAVIRVHDVQNMADVIRVASALWN